jgi:hypothetical protein
MKEMVGKTVERDVNCPLCMPTICYSKCSITGGFTSVLVFVFAIAGVFVFS